jgi:hypothetical protein
VPRLRRLLGLIVALAALWLLGLAIAGVVLAGRTRDTVAARIAGSLQATATIDEASLSLLRGRFDLARLAVRRDDLVGHLAITVGDIACDLPPLGGALFDRTCRELALRDLRLEVSAAALFRLERPKRPPLHARHVTIDDARLELAASALAPSLGQVAIRIAHAEAGDTTFKTPLSFLLALQTLRATVELPAGIALQLDYANGELRVSGGIFGATPIALPIAIPVADLAEDPRGELARLVAFGKDVAERLVAARAAAWLKSKLSP